MKTTAGYERPVVIGELDDAKVDTIFDMCPGTRVERLPVALVDSDTHADPVWGPWRRLVRDWATDPVVRHANNSSPTTNNTDPMSSAESLTSVSTTTGVSGSAGSKQTNSLSPSELLQSIYDDSSTSASLTTAPPGPPPDPARHRRRPTNQTHRPPRTALEPAPTQQPRTQNPIAQQPPRGPSQ